MLGRHCALGLFLVLAAGLASCGPGGVPINLDAEESALRQLDEQWSAAAAKNDLDGTVAFYGDGAVLLPPNAPIATDSQSIRASWGGLLGPNTAVSWKVTRVEVARSGDLGYLYGAYDLTIKDPQGGAPVTDKGKLLEVWKKQADGKWKCIVDTYKSDLPAAGPPEPKK
jgi:ketosteroid isomerase-like protein